MKRTILCITLFIVNCVHAEPFVTTFVNTSGANIHVEMHFSNQNKIVERGIAMSQSYQVVNFDNEQLVSVKFSSLDKDKNGNLYSPLVQPFQRPKADETYNIALEIVPAHTVPAADGTDSFSMPDSQKITCTLAAKTVEKTQDKAPDTSKDSDKAKDTAKDKAKDTTKDKDTTKEADSDKDTNKDTAKDKVKDTTKDKDATKEAGSDKDTNKDTTKEAEASKDKDKIKSGKVATAPTLPASTIPSP